MEWWPPKYCQEIPTPSNVYLLMRQVTSQDETLRDRRSCGSVEGCSEC